MRKSDNLAEDTPAKRKFIKRIKHTYPEISNSELNGILNDIRKLVNVTQKIISEPQATFSYKTKKKDGKEYKIRYINTEIKEVGKILKKDGKKSRSLQEAFKLIKETFPEK